MFLYRPIADRYDPYLLNSTITYPHNMHPVLVPGISVDGQLNRYGVEIGRAHV